jgi:transposase
MISPGLSVRDAVNIGPATTALCELILERRPHPEQGFRACIGILRLVRPFGAERLEAAAARAIEIKWLWARLKQISAMDLTREELERTPNEERCDLFSRETRAGFVGWGNEHGKFDHA